MANGNGQWEMANGKWPWEMAMGNGHCPLAIIHWSLGNHGDRRRMPRLGDFSGIAE
jgi:hypothetical protein